jgi:hypothetical protein
MCAFCVADNGTCDRPIDPTNQNQYVVWGVGSLGATAFQHHTRATGEFIPCIMVSLLKEVSSFEKYCDVLITIATFRDRLACT